MDYQTFTFFWGWIFQLSKYLIIGGDLSKNRLQKLIERLNHKISTYSYNTNEAIFKQIFMIMNIGENNLQLELSP